MWPMLFCLIHSSHGLGNMGNNNIFDPLTREAELFQITAFSFKFSSQCSNKRYYYYFSY